MKKNKKLDKTTQALKELAEFIDRDIYPKSTELLILLDKASEIVEATPEIAESVDLKAEDEEAYKLNFPNFDFSGTAYEVRDVKTRHKEVLREMQDEWSKYNGLHTGIRNRMNGIRSSQISALIMYLVKKGVL